MKKLLYVLAAVLLVVGTLPGCTGPGPKKPEEKTTLTIGVSVYDQYDTYIGTLMDRLKAYARELEVEEGVVITILHESANGNQLTQNSQVEGFIETGCDILCVNLVDRTEASVIIDKAEAAGTPIIFFNRELVEEDLERWDHLYYVGAVAEESGELQGVLVTDLLLAEPERVDCNDDGVVQYVMLEGEAGHQDAIVRTEYSINTVMAAGFGTERLGADIANWSRAQAETRMTAWLQQFGVAGQGGKIEVVFANNDDMALGAIDALYKAEFGREYWPVIVGIDGTPEGLAAVSEGEMYGTVFQDAAGQADSILALAWALAMGGEMPDTITNGRYIRMPHKTVTQQNAEEYLAVYE